MRDDDCLFFEALEKAKKGGRRPRLFLHACCGPCLTYPFSLLCRVYDVTVGYLNPNIQPLGEYDKREKTLQSFLFRYSRDENVSYSLVTIAEDFADYKEKFFRRYQDHENGATCLLCHEYRMDLAYRYAAEHFFDCFTTVMTVSSRKPSREINDIGEKLSRKYPGTSYLFSDFKKHDGQLKGIEIARKYGLYRQNYCGCFASLLERQERLGKDSPSLFLS